MSRRDTRRNRRVADDPNLRIDLRKGDRRQGDRREEARPTPPPPKPAYSLSATR